MVIDEWQKDVSLQGIRWNDEHISQLIRDGLIRNFGDMYRVSIVQAGAAIEELGRYSTDNTYSD